MSMCQNVFSELYMSFWILCFYLPAENLQTIFEGFTPPCDTSQIGHFQLSLKLNVRIRVSNVSVFQLIQLLEAKSEVTLRSPSFRFNQASIIILTNYSVAIPQLTNPRLFPLVTQILHSEPIVIYKWEPGNNWADAATWESMSREAQEVYLSLLAVPKWLLFPAEGSRLPGG